MGFKGSGTGLHLERDPDEVRDYVFDLSLWLGNDTLANAQVTGAGVTVDSHSINTEALVVTEGSASRTVAPLKALTVWLSGGTQGTEGRVEARLTTTGGRRRDVSVRVLPRHR